MSIATQLRTKQVPMRLYAIGAIVTAFGAWPFLHPSSFYERIATYPPFNEHLFHDSGAFLMGLGVALLAAARWRDGLTVALAANAAAAVLHAVAHFQDRDLGGKAATPWLLSVVAVAFVVPALRRIRRQT